MIHEWIAFRIRSDGTKEYLLDTDPATHRETWSVDRRIAFIFTGNLRPRAGLRCEPADQRLVRPTLPRPRPMRPYSLPSSLALALARG